MKNKFLSRRVLKKSLAWMLALTMAFGETGYASAEGLSSGVSETELMVSEVTTGVTTGDIIDGEVTDATGEDASEGDASDSNVSDSNVSDGSVSDGDASDGDASDGNVLEADLQMFPGLAAEYTLSKADISDKAILEDYSAEWGGGVDGETYVSNEIMVEAESEEEALAYAEAFNGSLKDFFLGTAVITLNADDTLPEATVYDAVCASAQTGSRLPAAWPNYYRYIDDAPVEEVAAKEVQIENVRVNTYTDPFLDFSSTQYQWHHNVMNSRVAWNAGYKGKGTKVVVLDTGIKSGHEDVTAVATYDVGYGTEDGQGHGTHVCGIIGAGLNNGKGGSGVAPECSLYSIKVLNDNGSGDTATIIAGVYKAVEIGADIVNMSLGGDYYNAVEAQAYEKAYEAGVAVFCAAGNESANSAHYPAGYQNTISVAALEPSLSKAYFSNYDSGVRYAAPGVDIYSTYYEDVDSYKVMSGTSQATPVTVGAAAVIWPTLQGSGTARVEELLSVMDSSCTKVSGKGLGKGCVNLAKALGLSDEQSAPAKPVFSLASGTYYAEPLSIVLESPDPGCAIYYSLDGKAVTYKNGQLSSNAMGFLDEISISGKTSVTINAIAIKTSNQMVSQTATAKYVIKLPVKSVTIKAAVATMMVGTSQTLTADCAPSNAANKKVMWSIDADKASGVTISSAGKVTASKKAKPGAYKVTARALGADQNEEVTDTFFIYVSDAIDNPITSITSKKKSVTLFNDEEITLDSDIVITKKDKTKGTLSDVSWQSADTGIAEVFVSTEGQLGITGVKAGTTKITGTATDGSGKTFTLKVTVVQRVKFIAEPSGNREYRLAQGKSLKLGACAMPYNAYNKKLVWSVSPENAGVTVSNGTVKAAKNATGAFLVTAKAADGGDASFSYRIGIKETAIKKLTVEKKSVDLFRVTNSAGAATSAEIAVDCDQKDWKAESSNPLLVTVAESDGGVQVTATGNGTGTATISVIATDGSNKKASFKVNVKNPASSLVLASTAGKTVYVAKGTSMQLSATLGTEYGKLNADAKKLTWTSSNPSVVKVDNKGKVTAMVGYIQGVYITARTTDGSNLVASYLVGSCEKVTKMTVGVYKAYTMEEGGSGSVALRQNGSAYNDNCSYVVDVKCNKAGLTAGFGWDNDVPRIYFTANKKGTYTVTVSCMDGSSAKATVKVTVK